MKHSVRAALATWLVCWQCFRQQATLSWASSYANCISILQPNQIGYHPHGMLISLATHSFLLPPLSPAFPHQYGQPLRSMIYGLYLLRHSADDPGQHLPLLINCQIIFGKSTYAQGCFFFFLEAQFSTMIIY